MITNPESGTRIDEIAPDTYRICVPVSSIPGGFTFNQYLIIDTEPFLFHTGPKRMVSLVIEAIASVLPIEKLRWIGFSHHENDEDGSMNELLALAPRAHPVCGKINAKINGELYLRPPQALKDGDILELGHHRLRWIDTPHLPHAWECGYFFDLSTSTLFCGDIFTQTGADVPPITESADAIIDLSEMNRIARLDYYAYGRETEALIERLAATEPKILACMHGSAYRGDGAKLLRELNARLKLDESVT